MLSNLDNNLMSSYYNNELHTYFTHLEKWSMPKDFHDSADVVGRYLGQQHRLLPMLGAYIFLPLGIQFEEKISLLSQRRNEKMSNPLSSMLPKSYHQLRVSFPLTPLPHDPYIGVCKNATILFLITLIYILL